MTSPPSARASRPCPEDARASRYWQGAPRNDPGETCTVTGGAAGRTQLTTPAASKTASSASGATPATKRPSPHTI
eukprot:2297214-Alexandrium_andersonii.AAC.1